MTDTNHTRRYTVYIAMDPPRSVVAIMVEASSRQEAYDDVKKALYGRSRIIAVEEMTND